MGRENNLSHYPKASSIKGSSSVLLLLISSKFSGAFLLSIFDRHVKLNALAIRTSALVDGRQFSFLHGQSSLRPNTQNVAKGKPQTQNHKTCLEPQLTCKHYSCTCLYTLGTSNYSKYLPLLPFHHI
jgi:hypothetical protein